MKVGDLVRHGSSVIAGSNPVGIITRLWGGGDACHRSAHGYGDACHRSAHGYGGASVLFEDGEYDVGRDDLEVINEGR